MLTRKEETGEVYKLPIAKEDDRRKRVTEVYSTTIWRINDIKQIIAVLENLYEDAYSAGLKDMDRMHRETDKSIIK